MKRNLIKTKPAPPAQSASRDTTSAQQTPIKLTNANVNSSDKKTKKKCC